MQSYAILSFVKRPALEFLLRLSLVLDLFWLPQKSEKGLLHWLGVVLVGRKLLFHKQSTERFVVIYVTVI